MKIISDSYYCNKCGYRVRDCIHKEIGRRVDPLGLYDSPRETIDIPLGVRLIPDVSFTDKNRQEYQRQLANNNVEIKTMPQSVITTAATTNVATTDQSEWVQCNLCPDRVHLDYLDTHLRVHIQTFKPKAVAPTITTLNPAVVVNRPSTALALVPSSSSTESQTSTVRVVDIKPLPKKISVSPREVYSFRKFPFACATSNSSKDNKIIDFTLVLWGNDRESFKSTGYAGGTYASSTEWERLVIHTTYNAIDRYYFLKVGIFKRSSYSTWDTPDNEAPERICEQEELMTEIKRALLFLRVSPKGVYKKFKKLFKEEMKVGHHENGNISFVQTKSIDALNEKLKKNETAYSSSYHNYRGGGLY